MAGQVVNLATKFSGKVAGVFKQQSFTENIANTEYDGEFIGANTIKIYSRDVIPLGDYNADAQGDRYGVAKNQGNTLDVKTLTQKKSATWTIDKTQAADMPAAVANANESLRENIDVEVIPTVDKYRFGKWAIEAGMVVNEPAALTKSNIMERIYAGQDYLDNNRVPANARFIVMPSEIYNMVKLSPEFVRQGDTSQKIMQTGVVGEIDAMKVIKVPRDLLPAGVNFMIMNRQSLLAPQKLDDYKVHKDPPGVSGYKIEFLIYHDAFVLAAKRNGVYVSCAAGTAANPVTITPATGAKIVPGTDTITLASSGNTAIYYTTNGSDPKSSPDKLVYSAAIPTAGWVNGQEVKAYAAQDGKIPSGLSVARFTV